MVVSISYSGTGHAFLVCTAGSQPKVGECLAVVNFRRAGFMFSRASGMFYSRVKCYLPSKMCELRLKQHSVFCRLDIRPAKSTLVFIPCFFGVPRCLFPAGVRSRWQPTGPFCQGRPVPQGMHAEPEWSPYALFSCTLPPPTSCSIFDSPSLQFLCTVQTATGTFELLWNRIFWSNSACFFARSGNEICASILGPLKCEQSSV